MKSTISVLGRAAAPSLGGQTHIFLAGIYFFYNRIVISIFTSLKFQPFVLSFQTPHLYLFYINRWRLKFWIFFILIYLTFLLFNFHFRKSF